MGDAVVVHPAVEGRGQHRRRGHQQAQRQRYCYAFHLTSPLSQLLRVACLSDGIFRNRKCLTLRTNLRQSGIPEIGTPELYPSDRGAGTGGVITVASTRSDTAASSQHPSVRVLVGHLRKSHGKPK